MEEESPRKKNDGFLESMRRFLLTRRGFSALILIIASAAIVGALGANDEVVPRAVLVFTVAMLAALVSSLVRDVLERLVSRRYDTQAEIELDERRRAFLDRQRSAESVGELLMEAERLRDTDAGLKAKRSLSAIEKSVELIEFSVDDAKLRVARSGRFSDFLNQIAAALVIASVIAPVATCTLYFFDGAGGAGESMVRRDWRILVAGGTMAAIFLTAATAVSRQSAGRVQIEFALQSRVDSYQSLAMALQLAAWRSKKLGSETMEHCVRVLLERSQLDELGGAGGESPIEASGAAQEIAEKIKEFLPVDPEKIVDAGKKSS